jgi:protein SCO1/2
MRRETSWCAGSALLWWMAGLSLAPTRAAADDARWGAEYFPNVPLVTQDGKVVRFHDDLLAGKIVAIELVYTRCRFVCPLETARLAQVQRLLGGHLGKDVFFYSIGVDPRQGRALTPARDADVRWVVRYPWVPFWISSIL